MIRKNLLNFKIDLKKISSLVSLMESFMKKFNPEKERCPFCNAIGQCRLYASYERHIVAFIGGKVISSVIKIYRVRCTCGHTHAILPDFIVPYRQYSLPFILLVLKSWFTHSMTLEEILETYGVSHKVLKQWKDIYGKHKDLWLGIVRSSRFSALGFLEQLLDLDPFSGFTDGFFQKTLYSFLQSHANPANCRQHPPCFSFS
jgi:hypothetical protein